MKTGEEGIMKRVVLAAIMLALALSAGVSQSTARPVPQAGNALLGVLPNGNAVLLVDVQRVTSSALWTALASQDKFHSSFNKIQSELSEVGLTINDLQTVAISFSSGNTNNPAIAVAGNLNQSALLARLRADSKVKVKSETYKGFEVFKVEPVKTKSPAEGQHHQSDPGSFAFLDAGTVVAGSPTSVRAAIDVKTGSQPSIAQNAKLNDALAASGGAAVRFAAEITPALASHLPTGDMGDFSSINLIFGGIDVTSGIDLNATLRNDTAEHAQSVTKQLNSLLDMARTFLGSSKDPKMAPIVAALKSVSITGSDIDVHVTGNVPMEVLGQLFH